MVKILIIGAIGALFLSTAVVGEPSYTESPWANMSCWTSNTPNNPQFEVIYDDELQTDVMRLYGDYVNYYFKLTNEGRGPLLKDKKYHYLSFSLKADNAERFIIYVSLKTTKGDRCLRYEALDYNRGREYYNQAIYGLGVNIQDGNWHTIYRDMNEDLKKIFPEEEILEVAQILFVGNLYISNVRFYKELPQDAEITIPKISRSRYEYIYNEETKQQICVRYNDYDDFGNLEWYYIKYIYYGTYDPSKEVSDKNYAQKWVWYIYNPDNNLTNVSITYYDTYQYNSKYLYYDPEMIPRCEGISRYIYKDGDWFLNGETTYFKKDGTIWYKHERRDDNYRGWKNGHRWIIYKWPDGTIFRSIYEEFIHKGRALKESYNTVYDGDGYDSSGTIISKITRYHTPESCWPYGEWYEKENFKGDEAIYTKGRIIYFANTANIQCLMESDYDKNNQIKETRLVYFNFDDLGENINKIQTLYYDNKGKLKYCEEKTLNPWNSIQLHIIRTPEILEQGLIKTEIKTPDSKIIDNNFQSKCANPYWKPLANESGTPPIYKKEKINIDGKSQKVLRIEKPHEAEETGPVFVQQYVPISGGEYKLVFKYQRLTGKAVIRGEWIPIDSLWTTDEADTLTVFEETDDFNEGVQDIEIPFTTPDEPGILILKLGAASKVDYIYVDIKPYIPDPGLILPPPQPEPDPITPPLPDSNPNPVQPPSPIILVNNTIKETQQLHKETPSVGGYIIVLGEKEKDKEEIEDFHINPDIKIPRKETIPHIRTTRGDAIERELEEEEGLNTADSFAQFCLSSFEKAHEISEQDTNKAAVASPSTFIKKQLATNPAPQIYTHSFLWYGVKGPGYYINGLINSIKEGLKMWLTKIATSKLV